MGGGIALTRRPYLEGTLGRESRENRGGKKTRRSEGIGRGGEKGFLLEEKDNRTQFAKGKKRGSPNCGKRGGTVTLVG